MNIDFIHMRDAFWMVVAGTVICAALCLLGEVASKVTPAGVSRTLAGFARATMLATKVSIVLMLLFGAVGCGVMLFGG